MRREPGIRPAQLTCPNTDTDHSDQSVPVLFAPLFLEGPLLLLLGLVVEFVLGMNSGAGAAAGGSGR